MNEINYLIVNQDHEIIEHHLDLIYTLHHFIRGRQFNRLSIDPAVDTYEMQVPVNGACDQENTLIDFTVQQLKKIQFDDETFYLVAYTLDLGDDTEAVEP